jgi:hypothetical protein
MAYQFTAANSRYLSTTSTPTTAAPFTISCWGNLPSLAGIQSLVSIESGNSNDIFLLYAFGGTQLAFFTQRQGGSFGDTGSGFTFSANTWFNAIAVERAVNSRSLYLNGGTVIGGSERTNTTNTGAPAVSRIAIGARYYSGTLGGYANGLIAEVGIWNVELTESERVSLARGMTCDKVRPQSLVFYAPLVRDLQDTKGGLTITNNNAATVANHPRVYA